MEANARKRPDTKKVALTRTGIQDDTRAKDSAKQLVTARDIYIPSIRIETGVRKDTARVKTKLNRALLKKQQRYSHT